MYCSFVVCTCFQASRWYGTDPIQIHLCPDLQEVCVRVRIRHRIVSSDQVNQLTYRTVIHNHDVKTVHAVPVHV